MAYDCSDCSVMVPTCCRCTHATSHKIQADRAVQLGKQRWPCVHNKCADSDRSSVMAEWPQVSRRQKNFNQEQSSIIRLEQRWFRLCIRNLQPLSRQFFGQIPAVTTQVQQGLAFDGFQRRTKGSALYLTNYIHLCW